MSLEDKKNNAKEEDLSEPVDEEFLRNWLLEMLPIAREIEEMKRKLDKE